MELNIIDIFDSEKELHSHYPNDKKYSTKDVIEYWPSFLHDNPELKIRDVVYYEIDKILSCKTPKLGGLYGNALIVVILLITFSPVKVDFVLPVVLSILIKELIKQCLLCFKQNIDI